MTWTKLGNGSARFGRRLLLFASLVFCGGLAGACGLLDVTDPTQLEDDQLNNSAGAEHLRRDAVNKLSLAIGHSALASGLLADEFFYDPSPFSSTIEQSQVLDQRDSELLGETLGASESSGYGRLQVARRAAIAALPRVRAYAPQPARPAYTGQVLALRGYATLRLAEDFCPGFPLNDIVNGKLVYGPPVTTTQALEQALADFDSAVMAAVDTARFLHLARVGRARTLLALGRFAEAAAAAQPVPVEFVWHAEFSTNSQGLSTNPLVFRYSSFASKLSVSDNEGGNGLDFVSAADARVVTSVLGPAADGTTSMRSIGKYPSGGAAPIVVASGIEARLIEAEAALRAGDPSWLTILNELRATRISPPLDALADPGSADARVDLLFRERAFWLFATGSRLADLRRLIQHYDRSSESVFPSGAYRLGGAYGLATSVPFPVVPESFGNPAITGCTSR